MTARIIFLATAALVLATGAYAGEPVIAYGGARSHVKARHLMPVMKTGEGYGQKYTFNADFEGRGDFYYSLTIFNLGVGDHKMQAKFTLNLDGQKFRWKKELSKKKWSYSKDKLLITAGPSTLSGTPKALVLKGSKGDQAYEFTFTPIAQPWRPQNGQIQFGDKKKITDYTIFPLMQVEGRAKVSGGEWQTLSGLGYASTSWSELGVQDQAKWVAEFRGISGRNTVYLREMKTTSEYGSKRLAYLLVTREKEILVEAFNDDYEFLVDPKDIMTDNEHANRYRVPETFSLRGKDHSLPDQQFRGAFKKKKLRKRRDLLSGVSAASRFVAERFSKPVRYEYTSGFTIEVKTKDGVVRIEGEGNYDLTHFNK